MRLEIVSTYMLNVYRVVSSSPSDQGYHAGELAVNVDGSPIVAIGHKFFERLQDLRVHHRIEASFTMLAIRPNQ